MKKVIPLTLLAGLILSGGASAQDYSSRPNLYGGAATSILDSETNLDNGQGWLVGAELPFGERWSGALEYYDLDSEEDLTSADARLDYTRFGANYNLKPDSRIQPYLAIGVGSLDIEPSTVNVDVETVIDFGLGVKAYFTDHLFMRGDIKALRGDDTNILAGLALGYAFGSNAPAARATPVAAAADSDGDGVFDNVDACRNTPAGTPVDSRGCELDDDRDTVANSRDNCPATPLNLAVDANGCPILETHQERQTLLVTFGFNEDTVEREFSDDISTFSEFMKTYNNTNVVIEGHTDSRGTEEYNQSLSERRAAAVKDELVGDGIAASRISTVGFGEARPKATNDTDEGRAQNRRIEAAVSVSVESQRPR